MKLFVIPIILWIYIFSVVLAQKFWAVVYEKLMAIFDLSPNQGWILPVAFNVFVAILGIPQIVTFIASVRRGEKMRESRLIAAILCFAAVALSLSATAKGVVQSRNRLATAAREMAGGEQKDVFAAGRIADGLYSNTLIGVAVQLPKDWHLMTLNAIRRAKHSGSYTVSGNNAQRAEELAAERHGSYTLLAVRRYPDDFTGYNPSLVLNAHDKQAVAAAGIRTLEAFASTFAAIPGPHQVLLGPSLTQIGNKAGYHIHIESRYPAATIQQHFYLTETDTSYIVPTASVIDEADMVAMRHAIATLSVNKNMVAH